MRAWAAAIGSVALALGRVAAADSLDVATKTLVAPAEPRRVVGFRAEGDTKVKDRTLAHLSHVAVGELVTADDLPRIVQALVSSELFEKVDVRFDEAPGGVIVVATLDDKHSWVVAPTLYFLAGARAFGVGFAENNLFGENKKLLLYGQYGTKESLFFGTFLDPSVRGTPLRWRFDVYLYRRSYSEFANPVDDPTNDDIARTTTTNYIGGGALVGWTLAWWLVADFRLRGARLTFRDSVAPDGTPLPVPQDDGYDVSAQTYFTIDARHHHYGVTWGPYVQLHLDVSIPGLDDYLYQTALLRAYYSWRLFEEHQVEVRTHLHAGRKLPYHEELSLGGVPDLRGYAVGRFRGDLRALLRGEYSVPLFKWRSFAWRAIGFFDSGAIGYHTQRDDRSYLPGHEVGTYWVRNDVGVGLRLYLKAIVLPLLGLDFAYGLEGKQMEIYFEVGLTDF